LHTNLVGGFYCPFCPQPWLRT